MHTPWPPTFSTVKYPKLDVSQINTIMSYNIKLWCVPRELLYTWPTALKILDHPVLGYEKSIHFSLIRNMTLNFSPSTDFINVNVLHHLYVCPLKHKSDKCNNYILRLDLTKATQHLYHKDQLVEAACVNKSHETVHCAGKCYLLTASASYRYSV